METKQADQTNGYPIPDPSHIQCAIRAVEELKGNYQPNAPDALQAVQGERVARAAERSAAAVEDAAASAERSARALEDIRTYLMAGTQPRPPVAPCLHTKWACIGTSAVTLRPLHWCHDCGAIGESASALSRPTEWSLANREIVRVTR